MSRIREHISNSLAKAVWGHWEVIGIGEPTSDQKLRPIVAVRGHCWLGSLFVEQMFKFENLFILVVWIFPLFSILLSLTADNWVRKVCVPSILSLEFSKLGVPLFLMISQHSIIKRPRGQKYFSGNFRSSYLSTTKLSCLQKNNFGQTNLFLGPRLAVKNLKLKEK